MREPYETLLGQYRDHWALWPFLEGDDPEFENIITSSAYCACSSGEQVMLRVAHLVWDTNNFANLDERNRSRVLVALAGVLAS